MLRDHFIPHAGNDYWPLLLRRTAVAGLTLMAAISFTIANLQALVWMNVDWLVSTILPAVIVTETNAERQADNVTALVRNPVLDQAAQLKAEHMATNSYFAHYAPDGTTPWHWFNEAGYRFVHAGENLAVHFNDSATVVEAWMNSPLHRANIMNGQFREIGIGVAKGRFEGFDTVFVVQLFGSPAAAAAITPVTQLATGTTAAVPTETFTDLGELATVAGLQESVAEPAAVLGDEVSIETTAVTAEDGTVSIFSKTITTSTNATPLMVEPSLVATTENSTARWGFLTQPQLVLQILFFIIGLIVVVALALAIVIEIRRQHPLQIAYGSGLLMMLGALYYLHTVVTAGVTIV